jgi:hypothetical protein
VLNFGFLIGNFWPVALNTLRCSDNCATSVLLSPDDLWFSPKSCSRSILLRLFPVALIG